MEKQYTNNGMEPHKDEIHYHLYDDRSNNVEIIGPNVLTENGHMTYSPDGNWLLSDTYPDDKTNERIYLYITQKLEFVTM